MSSTDVGTARAVARDIIRQVVGNDDFASRLRREPRETLLGAGLPDWAIDDFVAHDLGLDSDVEGYSMDRCAVTSLLWVEGDGVDPQ
jgi:hypothetical protein